MYHRVFSSPSRLRGIGDVASDIENFPFGKYSAQTLVIQNQLNQKLVQNGFCPLIADGKLGPATCGAAITIGGLQPGGMILAPSTCSDFKQPNDASSGCGTGPSAPSAPASPAEPSSPSASPSATTTSATSDKRVLAIGFGVLALGVGLFAWHHAHS